LDVAARLQNPLMGPLLVDRQDDGWQDWSDRADELRCYGGRGKNAGLISHVCSSSNAAETRMGCTNGRIRCRRPLGKKRSYQNGMIQRNKKPVQRCNRSFSVALFFIVFVFDSSYEGRHALNPMCSEKRGSRVAHILSRIHRTSCWCF
jgi:hypothetical protein